MIHKYDEYPSLYLYDKLNVPYVLHSNSWDGPLWTGHCMMLNTEDSYGDAGFWHELAHWMVAGPTQRTLPDLALGKNVNSGMSVFATSSSPFFYHPDNGGNVPNTSNLDGCHTGFSFGWGRGLRGYNEGWGELPVPRMLAAEQELWACHALQYYEPLCGITSWDKALPINSAIDDFAGADMPEYSDRVAEGCYKRFVEPLNLGTLEEVKLYTKLCGALDGHDVDNMRDEWYGDKHD